MPFPHYSYPPSVVLGLAAGVFFGGRRSFRGDGGACLARLQPPLRLLDRENVPAAGPCLITFNHYYRPGFDAWWMALALAAVVPAEIHFVMTGELTYPGKWYAPLGQAGSRWLLWRFAKIYGFTAMPPMPPRPRDVERRARAVRRALAYARAHPDAILGLAPEGGDQPGGQVSRPASGAGRFLLLLAGLGFGIVPVGVCEEAGELCLRFGPGYRLSAPDGLSADEKDRAAAGQVMGQIAALVPARLRGEFK
jgi:Acyltransferase